MAHLTRYLHRTQVSNLQTKTFITEQPPGSRLEEALKQHLHWSHPLKDLCPRDLAFCCAHRLPMQLDRQQQRNNAPCNCVKQARQIYAPQTREIGENPQDVTQRQVISTGCLNLNLSRSLLRSVSPYPPWNRPEHHAHLSSQSLFHIYANGWTLW